MINIDLILYEVDLLLGLTQYTDLSTRNRHLLSDNITYMILNQNLWAYDPVRNMETNLYLLQNSTKNQIYNYLNRIIVLSYNLIPQGGYYQIQI